MLGDYIERQVTLALKKIILLLLSKRNVFIFKSELFEKHAALLVCILRGAHSVPTCSHPEEGAPLEPRAVRVTAVNTGH